MEVREVRRADLYAAYRHWAEGKGKAYIEEVRSASVAACGPPRPASAMPDTATSTSREHRYYTGIGFASG